ncbi:PspC domain-containing protein [Actinomyces gaoshouyii]|uniref:Phage shock protein PspC N-terminal domain-containing protein n=1 Tax=Actinomyces gaoshouyii TaxID=1960083 RepID=A0A8H9HCJ7_9ACTO|nr:PspC domain-containing protein [Actinomyces gaoshouyii]GGO96665.1 hypothetical protein GCM10011612_07420 [Actinomyces gaoshouyii]
MSTTPPPSETPSSDPLGGPGAPFSGAPQSDPQAGPQPGAPQPGRPFMAGVFDSLRRSGVVRTERRVVGGVCGGLAQRLGIDLILVRCVVAVVCLALGLGLLAYGLAWVLLPEERDGRIHLQQAFNGDVSAGFVGALVCVISGLSRPEWGLGDGVVLGAPGWAGATWGLLWTAGVIGSIIWLVSSRRQQRAGQPPQPARPVADGTWSAPAGHPGAGWGAPQSSPAPGSGAASGPTWSAPAPAPCGPQFPYGPRPPYGPRGAAAPAFARPRPPRRPGPGRRMGSVIGGLLLLAIAGVALAKRHHMLDSLSYSHALLIVGSMTALLGAGVLVSGLIGRRGGWMSALGAIAVLITLPMLAASPFAAHGLDRLVADDVLLVPSDEQLSSDDVDLGTFGAGDTVLDLRALEQRHEGVTAHVSMGAGDLRVLVDRDQPVRIRTRVGAGQVDVLGDQKWAVEGTQDGNSIHTVWQGSTDESGTAASIEGARIDAVLTPKGTDSDVLTIDVSLGAGDVTIEESSRAWTASSPTASPSTTAGASPSASPSPVLSPTASTSAKPSGSVVPSPTPTH